MNTPPLPTNFLGRLLYRTGKFHIIFVLFLAQLITTPVGLALAAFMIRVNSDLTMAQIIRLAMVASSLMIIRNICLVLYAYLSSMAANLRLKKWSDHEPLESGVEEETQAWKQITSLPWRYIGIALTTLLFIVMPASIAYLYFGLDGTTDQITYLVFAAVASGLANAIFEVLITENALTNARLVLVPQSFDSQTRGIKGIRLVLKFLATFFALILIAILAIAPIGYHQTTKVIYEQVDPLKAVANLQAQSVAVAIFSLVIGFAIALIISNSISNPVRKMIQAFQKIEEGDLKKRVPITATDEVGELAVHFNHMISRLEELQTGLEKRVTERTEQLNATIEVGRVASSILNPDELISKVVNLITDRFEYYYAAIFISDESNRWAELKDATGTAGQILKAQGHRLELGGNSMVSSAITTHQARVAENVGAELVRFNNPLLPETRSEIALPLIAGGQTIGALDVQSTREDAFGPENIDTIQGMANQVAVALENARLFQATQASFDELRATHRLYISDAWSKSGREHDAYEYLGNDELPETGEESASVNVPLTLRDQIIGHLQLEGSQDWTPEERNLIEAVATQASLALENARLLEETQQVALRERLVADITGKIWSSPNTDIILQTAVKELGRALHADEATIELKLD